MKSWNDVNVPKLATDGLLPKIYDTAAAALVEAGGRTPGHAGMYVCGITPYDSTHMGHAATYLAFDTLKRAWLDAGLDVTYVQNVTDVDDPLLERATETGVRWQDLAADQSDLFARDMSALRVIPPQHYLGAVETIDLVIDAVLQLSDDGFAYEVEAPDSLGGVDFYFDVGKAGTFGEISHWPRNKMLEIFPERGGDPDREGKRDPLDPLLWRAERDGEPSWEGGRLGRGRPGWHIECVCIAQRYLGFPFDVQGGGSDLIFPHHEMGAAHGQALSHDEGFAVHYLHTGLVALGGEKMSKSRGNLVFISSLIEQGADPMAIRLALLDQNYRANWEWTDGLLEKAEGRLAEWKRAMEMTAGGDSADVISQMRERIGDDLDTAGAIAAVDRWVSAQNTLGGSVAGAPFELASAIDALLGVKIN